MRRLAPLLSTLLLPGCFTYPCEGDVLMCEEGEPLAAAECEDEAAGELSVQLREEDVDAPVPAGQWPVVHHGPQGGIHFQLGLRVEGMDGMHEQLEIELAVQACESADTCDDAVTHETRTLVVDGDLLEPEGDGAVLHDVVLLLEREPPANGRLVVSATDPCGRTATLVHAAAR